MSNNHKKETYSEKRTREKKRKKGKLRRYIDSHNPDLPEYCMICGSRNKNLVKYTPDGAEWHDILVTCSSCLAKLTMHQTDDNGVPLIQEIPDLIDVRNLPKHPHSNTMTAAKAKVQRWKNKYNYLIEDETCQICGKEDPIVKITDRNHPYKINLICRSCLYHTDEEDLPEKIDLLKLSDWEPIEPTEPSEDKKAYTERCAKAYMAYHNINPIPTCQVCGGKIKEGHINLFFPEPLNPMEVIFACDFCYEDASKDEFWRHQIQESDEEPIRLYSLV